MSTISELLVSAPAGALDGTEGFHLAEDPGGTPVSKGATIAQVGDYTLGREADIVAAIDSNLGGTGWQTGGGGGGGASAFTDLSDVPAAYTGEALKDVRVNAAETGLEFYTPSVNGGTMVVPASGDYIYTTNGASNGGMSGSTTATNIIRLYAFCPTRDVTVDGVAVIVASGSASNNVKAVIYASDSNGRPDALLAESGDMATDSTGTKTASIASLSLVAGNTYWVGIRATATISIQAIASSGVPDINGGSPAASLRKTLARTLTYATAAPDPWVWSSAEIGAGAAHHIWLKVA